MTPTKRRRRRDPSDVIRAGNAYYVRYTKLTRRNENYHSGYNGSIWYASSPDGHAWEEKGLCIQPGPDDAWEGHGVFTPNILTHEGKYYLFYTAVPEPFTAPAGANTTPTAVGVAVSNSLEGPGRSSRTTRCSKPPWTSWTSLTVCESMTPRSSFAKARSGCTTRDARRRTGGMGRE